MDLRSGCSYWTQERGDTPLQVPALDRDLAAHVVILGGGITGALAAHYLTEAGVDTIMVDRRDVAAGSTAASTGLLQYEIDKPLVELAKLVGQSNAARAYRLGVAALEEFEHLTRELADSCGFARRRSLFLATAPQYAELLREECRARRAIGLRVDFLNVSDLESAFGVARPGAILSHDAAQVDPVRLTTASIRRAMANGLRACARTQINDYQSDGGRVTLATDAGHRLHAEQVIFATGYETPEFLKDIPVKLKSTYAFAAKIDGGATAMRTRGTLIWETGTPYFYARTDGDDRVIAGGEDDDFADPDTRDARIAQKTQTLAKKLSTLFPDVRFEVDCAWAGTFAETKDSLPFIGPHPQFPGGLFALGYGGNGITFGLIAAQLLRDRILGRENPDAAIFRFDR
jgi:glycine/D-amino acid oxidase-like deaminating enzyme